MLVVMPSDHVIKDEPGFVAAVRRAAEVAATGKLDAVRHQAGHAAHRLRLYPPAGCRCRASRAPSAWRHSPRSPTRRPPSATLRPATTSGTAASSCSAPAPSSRSWRGSSPISSRPPAKRSPAPRRTWASCASTPQAFARAPAISVDYAVMERTGVGRGAAGRHRLERRRLVVVALGDRPRTMRRATSWRATRCWSQTSGLLRPLRARARLHARRQGPRHRRHPRRAAGRRPVQGAGRLEHRRAPQARQAQGAGAAPAQLPAVGLLRDAQPRPALPGQAAARQARRQALHADAPPSLRALGGGARHGAG